jgi:hypothetical protein
MEGKKKNITKEGTKEVKGKGRKGKQEEKEEEEELPLNVRGRDSFVSSLTRTAQIGGRCVSNKTVNLSL